MEIKYFYKFTFLSGCKCKESCKPKIYKATQRKVKMFNDSKWRLKIKFESNMVNIIREYPLYTFEELISQLGGTCGFFMGMSILSVFEIIFHIIISLFKWCIWDVHLKHSHYSYDYDFKESSWNISLIEPSWNLQIDFILTIYLIGDVRGLIPTSL